MEGLFFILGLHQLFPLLVYVVSHLLGWHFIPLEQRRQFVSFEGAHWLSFFMPPSLSLHQQAVSSCPFPSLLP